MLNYHNKLAKLLTNAQKDFSKKDVKKTKSEVEKLYSDGEKRIIQKVKNKNITNLVLFLILSILINTLIHFYFPNKSVPDNTELTNQFEKFKKEMVYNNDSIMRKINSGQGTTKQMLDTLDVKIYQLDNMLNKLR